ncbi:DUF2993 domain-containing protein [Geodermatophilus sp. DF01-2]|uniref:LmeA family phospholipid-binding protein n=1 Tax=Geodermatophilus sp. DF01-2 TaxID=2559610 RepID=UPI0014305C22|nr:DUF2993 domain-containing protein [Geodermatophilus sp. DF01_2]
MSRGRTSGLVPLLLGVLVGVGLLLWGLDRLAREAAESLLAEELQQATGAVQPPTVEIEGGPVLLQALRGRYDAVEVTMQQISNGPLTLDGVQAGLRGVHLSLHDLIVRDADAVVVERTATEARLGYDALDRYLGFTGRQLTVGPAGPGEVRVAGKGQVLDRSYRASAVAPVDAAAAALVVRPTGLRSEPALEGTAELLATERLGFRVPLDLLPFGREITGIEVGGDAVTVRTTGSGVVLRD